MNDYFIRDYNDLKDMEQTVLQSIRKRKDIKSKTENTVKIEQQITKELDAFTRKADSALKGYKSKYQNSTEISEIEANKRINMLNEIVKNSKDHKKTFDDLINDKYQFVILLYQKQDTTKYEGYNQREDIQGKDTYQLMDIQRDKLGNQDKQIGDLIGVAKQGNNMAVKLSDTMKDQNEKLLVVHSDMERTEEKMSQTRKKFDEFIEKSNFCCLYIVILLEIVALFFIIFML